MATVPTPPPPLRDLLSRVPADRVLEMLGASLDDEGYLPWDELRRRPAPAGFSHEEWWLGVKLGRSAQRRALPFSSAEGVPFTYSLPDAALAGLDEIARLAGGQVNAPELVIDPVSRDRYLINSLMEEAITSSQLEGAVTTRQVAKEMLRSGRPARSRSEQMVRNNFRAMRYVREHLEADITPVLVLELHAIVTEGTLDDPADAGRLQLPGEDRVGVWSESDDILVHAPPPAEQLPERLALLCRFANGETGPGWMHGALRAIITHFMVGYDHYFVDGNGRTARALFYWVALKNGLWPLEFTAISRILRNAPAQYGRSYIHTEQDEGDVTYFALHQIQVIKRAIADLHTYLERKTREAASVRDLIRELPINHRQAAIVEGALRDPHLRVTVRSHATSHGVTVATARTDLRSLEAMGLVTSRKEGRADVWRPVSDLASVLAQPSRRE